MHFRFPISSTSMSYCLTQSGCSNGGPNVIRAELALMSVTVRLVGGLGPDEINQGDSNDNYSKVKPYLTFLPFYLKHSKTLLY